MLGTLGIGTPIKVGLAVVAVATLAWLVDDYAWQRAERARLALEVAEAIAANQSLVQALDDAAAEHAAAVTALQAASAAERKARAKVETLLEELRHAPAEDDRDLSPTAQQFFDGLRGRPRRRHPCRDPQGRVSSGALRVQRGTVRAAGPGLRVRRACLHCAVSGRLSRLPVPVEQGG